MTATTTTAAASSPDRLPPEVLKLALAVMLQRQAAGAVTADALASAFAHTFWWAVGFAGLALVPALLLPSPHLRPVLSARRRPERQPAAGSSGDD